MNNEYEAMSRMEIIDKACQPYKTLWEEEREEHSRNVKNQMEVISKLKATLKEKGMTEKEICQITGEYHNPITTLELGKIRKE